MGMSIRNKMFISCLLAGCTSPALHAGDMGPVETRPRFMPFISGEAAYTSPQINGYNITGGTQFVNSTTSTRDWGGRFAAGGIYTLSNRIAIGAEMGWAYLFHASLVPEATRISGSSTYLLTLDEYGIDILPGLYYTQPKYDLFFKAGVLFVNLHTNASLSPDGTTQLNTSIPGAMAEIKLGGEYHLTKNWMATASWMHAFGGNLSLNAPAISFTPVVTMGIRNPTLDAIMLGVGYRFA